MKKTHIILIVVIAIVIAAMVGAINDSSTYANFSEAFENPGSEYHVVGKLAENNQMNYDPATNPDLFEFQMVDNNGLEKKVVLHKSKPQDFERSEQIVLIGEAGSDGAFHANEILMKCPSKYTDGEVKTKAEASL